MSNEEKIINNCFTNSYQVIPTALDRQNSVAVEATMENVSHPEARKQRIKLIKPIKMLA